MARNASPRLTHVPPRCRSKPQFRSQSAWGTSPTGETSHPYPADNPGGYTALLADITQSALSMRVDARAHFTQLDTEEFCGYVYDYAYLQHGDTNAVLADKMGGAHKGDYWSPWVSPADGHVKVQFSADGMSCAPWDGCSCSTSSFAYTGAALREYEYKRYQGVARRGSGGGAKKWWRQSLNYQSGWMLPPPYFDDSGWGYAVSEGAYGGWPWYSNAHFPAGTPANWIWNYDSRWSSDYNTVYFRRTFTASATQVFVTIAADDSFVAYWDGDYLTSTNNWNQPVAMTLSVTPNSAHTLAIQATNAGGPGGLLVDIHEAVTPFWTPLRFPGQYHDAETDFFENWNRYYDAQVGRYLSPEPMLQMPEWVKGEVQDGVAPPTYAYARNNPLHYTDPTGLFKLDGTCVRWESAVALAKMWAGCGSVGKQCEPQGPCASKLRECGGCNICEILENGRGPVASIEDVEFFKDSAGQDAFAATVISLSKPIKVRGSMFRQSDCDKNTYNLANSMLHEAAHACSESLNKHIGHGEPCGADSIAKACRQL